MQTNGNLTYQDISTGNFANWTAIDDVAPANYSLYINNSLFTNGFWLNATSVNINIDGLVIGLHNVTILFNDTSGNIATDTIWVTVFFIDTTNPVIINQPINLTYQDISTGNFVNWTAIDDYDTANYSLYIDNSLISNGFWLNASSVDINIDGLAVGLHNVTILFNDTSGNVVSGTIWVTVFADTNNPVIINQPGNLTYQDISSGNFANWTTIDDYGPANYSLYINGSLFANNFWLNATSVNINMDGLSVGLHNVTMKFNDTSGNMVFDTIWVSVFADTNNPVIINQPVNLTYLDLSNGNSVNWTAIDDVAPANYSLYINNSLFANGSWLNASIINFNIDGLAVGLHNVTILLNDTSNNIAVHTIWVTVFTDTTIIDTTSPIVTGPTEIKFVVGSAGQNISLNASDLYPDR